MTMENHSIDIDNANRHDKQVFAAAYSAWTDWGELRRKRRRNAAQ